MEHLAHQSVLENLSERFCLVINIRDYKQNDNGIFLERRQSKEKKYSSYPERHSAVSHRGDECGSMLCSHVWLLG